MEMMGFKDQRNKRILLDLSLAKIQETANLIEDQIMESLIERVLPIYRAEIEEEQ